MLRKPEKLRVLPDITPVSSRDSHVHLSWGVRSGTAQARLPRPFDATPRVTTPAPLLRVVRQHGPDRAIVHVGLSHRHHIDEYPWPGWMAL